MIHNIHNHAEIGDAVAWNIGFRYFIGKVHDTHRSGLILRIGGQYRDFTWDYFDTHQAVVITADYIQKLTASTPTPTQPRPEEN